MILFILDNARKNIRKFYVLCSRFYVKNNSNSVSLRFGVILFKVLTIPFRYASGIAPLTLRAALALSECRYQLGHDPTSLHSWDSSPYASIIVSLDFSLAHYKYFDAIGYLMYIFHKIK